MKRADQIRLWAAASGCANSIPESFREYCGCLSTCHGLQRLYQLIQNIRLSKLMKAAYRFARHKMKVS